MVWKITLSSSLSFIEVFPWNKNFDTGIKDIDEQHRQLVYILNKLANSLVYDNELETENIFQELADYAHYHFSQEEVIWAGYLGQDTLYKDHLESHSSFLPKVLKIKEQGADKPLQKVVEDIIQFLIRWLAFHIIDDDKRLSLILNRLEAGATIEQAKFEVESEMSGSLSLLIDTVLVMYDSLSSKALELMRERIKRQESENKLLILNKELQNLAITDQLTGLYNRRHFEHVFDEELRRAQRHEHFLALIMLDIDYFKKINDRYGHAFGDQALKQVSSVLTKCTKRGGESCFRLGGEEFCIISANETLENLLKLVDKIDAEIKKLKIENLDSTLSDYLTVSMGIYHSVPSRKSTIDTYLIKADKRLYIAKNTGRNKVVYLE